MPIEHRIPDIEKMSIEDRIERIDNSNTPSKFAIVPRKHELSDGEVIYCHGSSTSTLRKLFREKNIEETPIESDSLPVIEERDAALIGPVLYFSGYFLMNNWNEVETIIEIIKTYANDMSVDTASVGIKYESSDGEILNVDYEGDPDDLPDILDSIRGDYPSLKNNEQDLETSDTSDE